MFLISGPELVLAACREGVVGAFPTPNCRTSEALEEWLQKITTGIEALKRDHPGRTIGPWAATIMTCPGPPSSSPHALSSMPRSARASVWRAS